MKTAELIGDALDWAVARCEGMLAEPWLWGDAQEVVTRYKFSTDWAQGGPIIGREGISVREVLKGSWVADVESGFEEGPTPLIAAMRCYVASKLGDEVEVPDELH